jgi:hypothetical protein
LRLIATFALLAACGCSRAASGSPEADAVAVYEAFLGLDPASLPERVLLQEVTEPVTSEMFEVRTDPARSERMRLLAEVQQAVDDLVARGGTPGPVPAEVRISDRQTRISADSVAAIFRSTRDRAPHRLADSASVVQLSAVGFNRARTVAVVYQNVVCGYLCGDLTVRVLRKYPDGWLPAEELLNAVY